MRHLLSHSVYEDLSPFGDDVWSSLSSVGCDGLETLTAFGPADPVYREYTETVHLPYAVDWLAAWEDRPYDFDEETSRFVMYGRSREEVVRNLTDAIDCASAFSPAQGVLHAANADIFDIFHRKYQRDSEYVLRAFADMVNQIVGEMPGGEPPFRILFENLWWPGLRLTDESDFRFLSNRLEFDNWGICIDTGHMMSSIPAIYTQKEGIDALRDIFHGYSRDLVDRVKEVHFHWTASGKYRETFEEKDLGDRDVMEFYGEAYAHVGMIDQHHPFTDPACRDLVEILQPDYVVHEMPGREGTPLEEFSIQRSLLD